MERIRRRVEAQLRSQRARMMQRGEDQREYALLAEESFRASLGRPEVCRKAEFLEAFAERFPARIGEDELIVGSQAFNGPGLTKHLPEERQRAAAVNGNIGHIVVDCGRVLREGLCGLRERIAQIEARTEVARRNRDAFAKALKAFSRFIARHGEAARSMAATSHDGTRRDDLGRIAGVCEWISERPPQTFLEALQLLWFIHVFLHAEAKQVAISFGRLDQYVWPFLDQDLRSGAVTVESAKEILSCFWLKCCEGEESQNVVLGGVDAEGQCAENRLSLLCLEVAQELRVWQPSVSVRIGPTTSEAFWEATLRLCAAGFGMPSFLNDEVVIRSLRALDIPEGRARDWAVFGCYEATPQGDTYGVTVGGTMSLPAALLEYMARGTSPASFDILLDEFMQFMSKHYAERLVEYQRRWNWLRDNAASPFECLCVTGCLESGSTVEEGGARFSLFGVNILGLGTLVDSLFVQKELVFERKVLSLDEMREQLRSDFPDEHPELTVRISGFSARFVTLDRRLQDALIDRTERGM